MFYGGWPFSAFIKSWRIVCSYILKLVTVCLEECVDMRVAMYGILLLSIKPPALTMFKQTENERG